MLVMTAEPAGLLNRLLLRCEHKNWKSLQSEEKLKGEVHFNWVKHFVVFSTEESFGLIC